MLLNKFDLPLLADFLIELDEDRGLDCDITDLDSETDDLLFLLFDFKFSAIESFYLILLPNAVLVVLLTGKGATFSFSIYSIY